VPREAARASLHGRAAATPPPARCAWPGCFLEEGKLQSADRVHQVALEPRAGAWHATHNAVPRMQQACAYHPIPSNSHTIQRVPRGAHQPMCSRSLGGSPGIRSRRTVRQSGGGASQPGFSAGSGRGCVFGVAGFFTSSNGSDACGSCDEIEDQYQDSAGSSRCLHCPPNTRRDVREDAFKSVTGCVCKDGFFAPLATKGFECISCPQGGQCEGKLHLPCARYQSTSGTVAARGQLS
jgi:hypothetical protein